MVIPLKSSLFRGVREDAEVKGLCKGKVIPLHTMEAHGVRGGIAHTHSLPRH
jgi:hypothetical protein